MFEIIGVLAVIAGSIIGVSLAIYFVVRTIESWKSVSIKDYEWDKNYNLAHKNETSANTIQISSISGRLNDLESELTNLKRDYNIDNKSISDTIQVLHTEIERLDFKVDAIEDVLDGATIECEVECTKEEDKCQSKK